MKKIYIILITLLFIFLFSFNCFAANNIFTGVSDTQPSNSTVQLLINIYKSLSDYNPFNYYIVFHVDDYYYLAYSVDPTFNTYKLLNYYPGTYQYHKTFNFVSYDNETLELRHDNYYDCYYLTSNLNTAQLNSISSGSLPINSDIIENDKNRIIINISLIIISVLLLFKIFRIRIGDRSI